MTAGRELKRLRLRTSLTSCYAYDCRFLRSMLIRHRQMAHQMVLTSARSTLISELPLPTRLPDTA